MRRTGLLMAACAALALPRPSAGDPPLRPPPADGAGPSVPAGRWRVEFANGVVEAVDVRKDATATVAEPGRTAGAKLTSLRGTFLVVSDDDRVERWTPVGPRMVVEHWFPAARFPAGTPVRGIADHAE